jgi:hypothetical protein
MSVEQLEEYAVDISFYEKEVMKIVNEIEPMQISLFDLSSLGQSSKTRMDVKSTEHIFNEEKLTVFELNKLGKNQLAKKMESIVNNQQQIKNISPRYVYILGFDWKTMTAEIYCLAKGIKQSIFVEKAAYKKERFEKGSLVFCSKFSKGSNGYSIAEYKITDKIEEEKIRLENF